MSSATERTLSYILLAIPSVLGRERLCLSTAGVLNLTTVRSATQREPEAKETWRATDKDSLNEFCEKTTFKDWEYGVGDIVKNSEWIIKVRVFAVQFVRSCLLFIHQYGLYDRPELSTWHKGRVVLIGDAAHPTSPVRIPILISRVSY